MKYLPSERYYNLDDPARKAKRVSCLPLQYKCPRWSGERDRTRSNAQCR